MNLTFKGFLKGYCAELTGLRTTSLRRLCAACDVHAPSAAEAVFVLAAAQGKEGYLVGVVSGTWMEGIFRSAADSIGSFGNVEDWLRSESTPQRFRKVLFAYDAKKRAVLADRRVISLMREKTLSALESSGVTTYRLCSDLGLNRGNVYAYLNRGDATKVSRATARRIMEYAVSL